MDGFSVEVKFDHLQGVRLEKYALSLCPNISYHFSTLNEQAMRGCYHDSHLATEKIEQPRSVCVQTAAFEHFEDIRPAEKKQREQRLSLRLFTKMFEHFEGMKTAKRKRPQKEQRVLADDGQPQDEHGLQPLPLALHRHC